MTVPYYAAFSAVQGCHRFDLLGYFISKYEEYNHYLSDIPNLFHYSKRPLQFPEMKNEKYKYKIYHENKLTTNSRIFGLDIIWDFTIPVLT